MLAFWLWSLCMQNTDFVLNLSSHVLSADEQSLLACGLGFCPGGPSLYDIYFSLSSSVRRVRLKNYFKARADDRELPLHGCWRAQSAFNPPVSKNAALEKYLTTLEVLLLAPLENLDEVSEGKVTPICTKLKTLSSLKQNYDLVFKAADKGSVLVLLDRFNYIQEILSDRHLDDSTRYRKLLPPLFSASSEEILSCLTRTTNTFIWNFVTDYGLPEYMIETLKPNTPRLGLFYGMPKIHKSPDPFLPCTYPLRGICSCTNHPCSVLSSFIHALLRPILSPAFLPELCIDSLSLLTDLDSAQPFLPGDCFAATADVSSMFTEIPQKLGASSCAWAWSAGPLPGLGPLPGPGPLPVPAAWACPLVPLGLGV